MKLANTHYSYCSNIHSGASWDAHFEQLKTYLPPVKALVSPDQPFGLGLRLAASAAETLKDSERLQEFKSWLSENQLYVFTMNGFPYGDFHEKSVKDKVHFPDWTTQDRLTYTQGLFHILVQLLPAGGEGGISTSPLSYRFWLEEGSEAWLTMRKTCTEHIIQIAEQLHQMEQETGKYMHLDIEPEPDGVLENGTEFIQWFKQELVPLAISHFHDQYQLDAEQAEAIIKRHICICYDVCHFALEYEDHQAIMQTLEEEHIRIGKFQISSALKVDLPTLLEEREQIKQALSEFDEPIYLHQVIAKDTSGNLIKYQDLPEALPHLADLNQVEWRSHFHVPVFLDNYGEVQSTQSDIREVIRLQLEKSRTNHIEVETYTWGVLPKALQLPMQDSIAREMNWLLDLVRK